MNSRTARFAASALAGLAALITFASAADATTLRTGGALGPIVAAGTVVGGPLTGTATFAGSNCSTGTWAATVGTNPAPAVSLVAPQALSVDGCGTPPPPAMARVFSLALASSTSASVTANPLVPGSGTVTMTGLTFNARLGVPRNLTSPNAFCSFTISTATGTFTSSGTLKFVNVPVTSATGPCAWSLPTSLTVSFGPVQSASSFGTVGVY